MPSSGSMTSPLPEMTNRSSRSAAISSASRCRRALSLRQSLARLTAAQAQAAAVLGKFGLKPFAQGKGVRHGAGKPHHHLIVVKPAHLFRGTFHDGTLPHGDLPIAGNGANPIPLHSHNGRPL